MCDDASYDKAIPEVDDDDDDYAFEMDDDPCIEYSELSLHPRSKEIQKDFDVTHKVIDISVAEKIHFDEVYAEIKFLLFFGEEPTNNRNWYSPLQHNIRAHALYMLQKNGKIRIDGFDGTSAQSSLKISSKIEVLVPASGAFVITLADGTEVVIRLTRGSTIEWAVFCKNSVEYSKWDKMFRAAVKEYNQYKDSIFDQEGKFIDLPQVSFEDIFLDAKIREVVQTNIIDYIDEKKVLIKQHNGIPTKRGVIFAGDPGTGKTFLSRVLANTLNTTFMVITNLSSLNELKSIFRFVAQFDRVVLLFEDIDIYIKHRELGSGLLPTMLNALDGIETITNHLVVLCTTNNVESFDDALKNRPGRFDTILTFDAPNKDLKQTMLKGFCKEKDVADTDFVKVIDMVPSKYTGAHLKELYISACILAIEENSMNAKDIVILTTDIFERALNRVERGATHKHVIGFGNDNKE